MQRTADLITKALPALFVLIAAIAAVFCALLFPPFQTPDEHSHLMRADQISLGFLVGTRIDHEYSGGWTDNAIIEIFRLYEDVAGHPTAHVPAGLIAKTRAIPWRGAGVVSFPGSALYPPFFYAPSIIALWVGKAANIYPVDTLILARLLTAAVAISVAFAALNIVTQGRIFLFAMLTLPMTLAQFASSSQDALLIATTALSIALLATTDFKFENWKRFYWSVGLLALVTAARPTYMPLFLLPAWLLIESTFEASGPIDRRRYGSALAYVAAAASVPVLWFFIGVQPVRIEFSPVPGVSSADQVKLMVQHPVRFLFYVMSTIKRDAFQFAHQFVGVLGWLDVYMPSKYYSFAFRCIALVAGLSFFAYGLGRARTSAAVLVAIVACSLMTFAAMYISWTPVGAPTVDGVQGRYFIPLAFSTIFLFRKKPLTNPASVMAIAVSGLVATVLAAVSVVIMSYAIMTRYFG